MNIPWKQIEEELKALPDLRDILRLIDKTIETLEKHIAWSNDAMNAGLYPVDIEGSRVRLAELKKMREIFRSKGEVG